ncbi:SusC/RagA family TonB-linked outer membrane protein [Rudanella paleaurantiibacter]|uniref:SusC/RagA family TonB-linked outer membrane protein n=1 Tax=Rudanella paleaurantiibacter TaxID=2614655 RepID=A0A7J5U7L6_9BACT|nr:TonB-dependent receptor [Rudanella paleaurantiibacter]KAB7733160.1 SusC/RagA family TonB-linked outer membrane protein [Rudanella paleaurantiibacter]
MMFFYPTRPGLLGRILTLSLSLCLLTLLTAVAYGREPGGQDLLQRPVTINVQAVPMKTALKELERLTEVRIVYSPNTVPANRRVSLSLTNQRLAVALETLLKPVGLNYQVLSGQVLITTQPPAPQPTPDNGQALNESVAPAERIVTGTVTDEKGERLPGVTVVVKGLQRGATTNVEGQYRVSVPDNVNELVFSYVGYLTKEVTIGNKTAVNVVLQTDEKSLEEVVVVGYGTQKKSEQTAAISSIGGDEIVKAPVTDASNALVGRVPGLFAQQISGRPGINGANITIRGRASTNSAALIIVDGVERQSFGDIDPNEIESISVLKDASSTALFGIKGANGVIIVTTKTGKTGKPRVSYSGNVGRVNFTQVPEFLDAYESAMLHNEGEENLIKYGLVPPSFQKVFTAEDLRIFKEGTGDRLLYPNTNWFKAVTRPYWFRTQHNLNFTGGSKAIKYFVSMGYLFEDGGFKDFDTPSGYKTNPSYTRYNFRSNLDLNLTKTTTLSLRLGGRLEGRYSFVANSGQGDLRQRFESGPEYLLTRMYAIPAWMIPFYPEYTNPKTPEDRRLDNTLNHIEDFGRAGVNTFNPYAVMRRNGYADYRNNAIESVFVLDQKLDFITKGLGFKATFGYDAYIAGVRGQTGAYAAYNVDRATGTLVLARNSFEDPLGGVTSQNYGYIKTNLQLALNYARSFGKHNVSGVAVAQRELRGAEGAQAPFANEGLVLRATYNYASKYFVELNGSYNGSENYPKAERYGLFPAISAGWTVSEESFLKGAKWIDYLKLRGSYGLIGYGNVGGTRFIYLDEYSNGGSDPDASANSIPNRRVRFGTASANVLYPVVWHSRSGNPDVTWEKSIKRNFGVEAAFLRNRLSITADIFDEKRYDILLARNNSALVIYGESLPSSNYGENYNAGYEFETSFKDAKGNFRYGINVQYTHAKNRIVRTDEPINLPENQKNTGQAIGQFRGYKVIGFYQSLEDIANSPQSRVNGAVIPGDFKFADLNEDGIIDDQDRAPIGYADVPQNVFGIEPNFGYKGFTVSALFQGVTKVNSNVFFAGGNYYSAMLNRWTPENAQNATWPAIRPRSTAAPSYSFNDYLMQDASYLKLRNVEVSYAVPAAFAKRLNMETLRIYVTGQNLFTWTKFVGLDPENNQNGTVAGSFFAGPNNAIPVSRTFNLGVNIQF